jgi:arginine decarboxylase
MADALLTAAQAGKALFCTPGHKQGQAMPASMRRLMGTQAYNVDLPDLPGFNLFESEGVVAATQILAAQTFGADQTWFLVNGSTVGVMASILATCGPGDKIILPRNVHISAISGLILSGAHPIFISPEYDPHWDLAHCITPDSVALALAQHPDTKAIFMVSPTYHGVCGDVGAIAQLAHQSGIPLIVDEAHGAHFGFHPHLPDSALALGADLVVQSTHKTLSALTQASMLHRQGRLVNGTRVSSALQMLQSSSPSNLLLASLEGVCRQMATEGRVLMAQTLDIAYDVRSRIAGIPGVAMLPQPKVSTAGFCNLDLTRLTLNTSALGLDGFTADEILTQQFGIVAELPSLRHLTFIVSLGNRKEETNRLGDALEDLSQHSNSAVSLPIGGSIPAFSPPECFALSPRDAFFAERISISITEAVGQISAETLCPYPPGIPILLPGEVVTEEAIAYLQQTQAAGGLITGCADPTLQQIQVTIA